MHGSFANALDRTAAARQAYRIVSSVLGTALRDEVDVTRMRVLLIGVGDYDHSDFLADAVQYHCDCSEGDGVDLIGEVTSLAGLPDCCFDVVILNRLGDRPASESELRELRRVLVPGGLLLSPASLAGPGEAGDLERLFATRTLRGVDPDTGAPGEVRVAKKEASPAVTFEPRTADLTGYAYHLSRRAGRRIVFCLDGAVTAGDRLPITTATGDTAGHVTVGPYEGGIAWPDEPWKEGFRLPPRAVYELPRSMPSGVYALDRKIPFVQRSDRPARIAVLLPSNTGVAFSEAGGRNLYEAADRPRADILSFHRPLPPKLLLGGCWPFVRWFREANPHPDDTTYLVDADLEEPDALDGVDVLIVIGRSEYWTRAMRERFDAHVDGGGRALLLCSELMYWQVRVDRDQHQLVRYKEDDPHPDPLLRTTVWCDPSLEYPIFPRTGGEFSHGGSSGKTGERDLGWAGMRIVCPNSPLLADTGLVAGDVLRLPDSTVWDGAPVTYDSEGAPRVEFGGSPPWRHEVVGFNLVKPVGNELPAGCPATSLWSVLRRTPQSGTVIHCGTLGWCDFNGAGGHGPDSDLIRTTVLRMLELLLEDAWPFSYAVADESAVRSTSASPASRQ